MPKPKQSVSSVAGASGQQPKLPPPRLEVGVKLLADIPLTSEQKAAILKSSGLEYNRICVVESPASSLQAGAVGKFSGPQLYCW